MKNKLIYPLATLAVAVSTTCFAQVPTGPVDPLQASGIIEILTEIKGLVGDFYKEYQSVTGASADGFVAPTQVTTVDYNKIRDQDVLLMALYNNQAAAPQAQSQSTTVREILTLISTPRDYKYCTTCASDLNILSANDVMKVGVTQNFAVLPYDLKNGGIISGDVIRTLRDSTQNNDNSSNAIVNMDSLVTPLSIPKPQTGNNSSGLSAALAGTSQSASTDLQQPTPLSGAENFIKLASGLMSPIQMVNVLPQDAVNADTGINPRYNYIAMVLSYAARQSVGLSNLNYMLAKRMKPSDPNAPSIAELEKSMATRRLTPDWHDKMEKANPLTLQRETLYLLAEINHQLYQQRMLDERLLATVSVFQLQNLDINKEMIKNSQ